MNMTLRQRAMRLIARVLLVGFAAVVWIAPACAGPITFDDLSPIQASSAPIPNGYAGLNWNNFAYHNQVTDSVNGYRNGVVSAPYVAFNPYGGDASFASSSLFNFDNAYFTAAWNDGLHIDVTGYQHGTAIYSTTFTIDTSGPDFMVFNWLNVDQVSFSSYGGTPAGYNGGGNHFVMDNLSINALTVPEPSGLGLLALGLGVIGLATWRRRRRIRA